MMLRGTHSSFVISAEAGIHTGQPRKSPPAARIMDSRLRGNDDDGRRAR
jgi:hypothetical protein